MPVTAHGFYERLATAALREVRGTVGTKGLAYRRLGYTSVVFVRGAAKLESWLPVGASMREARWGLTDDCCGEAAACDASEGGAVEERGG